MSRPLPTLATIAASLHTALRAPAPWVSLTTERDARQLVTTLRTEALQVVTEARASTAPGDSLETAARKLGVSRRALATWLAAGGWLSRD